MNTEATSRDFVSSYIDAWNQHDAGSVAEHLSLDGVYFDIPIQHELTRDGLIEHLKEFFAQDKNRYQLVGEICTGETSIAYQYRAIPQDEGDNPGWMGAEFITMQGEIAGKIEDYYQDADTVRASRRGIVSQRYAKSGLDEAGLQKVMDGLTRLMVQEKVFLDPGLSLPQLALRLDCSVNHLSQAINAGFGMSFFDYVNQHRVKEAMSSLCCKEGGAPPILDIALSVGFNSTSTFYAAFKKSTGQSPGQYRRARFKA
ncbi:MAG: helix-turn-helix domain-containing protein [Halioglobus sp.]